MRWWESEYRLTKDFLMDAVVASGTGTNAMPPPCKRSCASASVALGMIPSSRRTVAADKPHVESSTPWITTGIPKRRSSAAASATHSASPRTRPYAGMLTRPFGDGDHGAIRASVAR